MGKQSNLLLKHTDISIYDTIVIYIFVDTLIDFNQRLRDVDFVIFFIKIHIHWGSIYSKFTCLSLVYCRQWKEHVLRRDVQGSSSDIPDLDQVSGWPTQSLVVNGAGWTTVGEMPAPGSTIFIYLGNTNGWNVRF